jgi:hypothetical protein
MTDSNHPPPDRFQRAAGLGGFGFLGAVVVENVLRQPQPPPNATLEQIVSYYQARPGMISLSESLFVISIPCLLLFAVGTFRRVRAASAAASAWALVGAIAACLMTATFGATMALDVVLNASADSLAANGPLTLLVWKLKMAFFIVNLVALSTALIGFGAGCGMAGVGPRWAATMAASGGVVGLVGAFPMRAVVAGSPWMLLGLICFVAWLVFLAVTSAGHLRHARG